MRVSIFAVALPILAAVALAQDTPPAQQKPPETPQADSSKQGQADRSVEQKSDKSSSATPEKSGAQASDKNGQGSDRLPEMKTQSYSGTLMDASCAGSSSTATAPATASATDSSAASAASSSSADRSAGSASNQGCSVSASTTQFAIKTKDGTTMRFDDVGNSRTQDALKTRKKWSESASASKPIHVKASGVLNGDKLTVMSID